MILVHELTAHTVSGVIGKSETIMQNVPCADELVVEAKVAPQDIDQVAIGSSASAHGAPRYVLQAENGRASTKIRAETATRAER